MESGCSEVRDRGVASTIVLIRVEGVVTDGLVT